VTAPSQARRRLTILVLTLAVVAGAGLAAAIISRQPDDVSGDAATKSATAAHPGSLSGATPPQPLTGQQHSAADAAIVRLKAMPSVAANTSRRHPPVAAEAREQPDLYAEAFTEQLLTQNYRSNRQSLLEWVQSESAQSNEPTVVGLTPPALRHKLAVASVQDASEDPAPVPPPAQWAALADLDGYTTVRIQRVFTPPTWTAAVAAGKVSDPGVTAREVDAQVTLHTVNNGVARRSVYSVALTMNLEGPPTRAGYGFVTAVTYHVVGGE
jgi:hypothetical protein